MAGHFHRFGPLVVNRSLTHSHLSTSLPNLTSSSKPRKSPTSLPWESPLLSKRCMAIVTTSGGLAIEPKRPPHFGLLKVFLTVMSGIGMGAYTSKKTAQFLEENELFVPEDDDDDDFGGDDDDDD